MSWSWNHPDFYLCIFAVAFTVYDFNSDGYVTKEEIFASFKNCFDNQYNKVLSGDVLNTPKFATCSQILNWHLGNLGVECFRVLATCYDYFIICAINSTKFDVFLIWWHHIPAALPGRSKKGTSPSQTIGRAACHPMPPKNFMTIYAHPMYSNCESFEMHIK